MGRDGAGGLCHDTPVQDYEKLGLFYLGRRYDLDARQRLDEPVLYEANDLVTHAVCVGMTGSGKTGLAIGLLEEAAIDGIPIIAIDPKGDLANLLLTFPGLAAAEFEPWVDPAAAAAEGITATDLAARTAETWRRGLAEWGQDGARIARLRAAAPVTVFTPGSRAGTPLALLASLGAGEPAESEDAAARISSAAAGLLALVGIAEAQPHMREHALISAILAVPGTASTDLPGLVRQIQRPAFDRIGVIDLETFYPARERQELALRFNAVLAAPGFGVWLQGEPLAVDRLLFTPAGRPRIAIISIAHLGDAERMLAVSFVLNAVLDWTRRQTGTSSLRALVYMDEVFGYLPPVANPPSKPPLLTLLKQARAFGVGVMLATQNPVDLDYKALSNTGTWFLGKLQTERDKARVLDGIEGLTSAMDRQALDRTLSALGKRVFLMHNVHNPAPIVFETRWTLSYLRGPMSKDELRRLNLAPVAPASEADLAPTSGSVAPTGAAVIAPTGSSVAPPREAPIAPTSHSVAPTGEGGLAPTGNSVAPTSEAAIAPAGSSVAPTREAEIAPTREARIAPTDLSIAPARDRPVAPAGITEVFLPGAQGTLVPALYASARVQYADTRRGVDTTADVHLLAPLDDRVAALDWRAATAIDVAPEDVSAAAPANASFAAVPAAALQPKQHAAWAKEFAQWLVRDRPLQLLTAPELKLTSRPGESERDFRIRLQQPVREQRDAAIARLRARYATKVTRLTDKVRRLDASLAREQRQVSDQKMQTTVSIGATLLGALMGRKAASMSTLGRATAAARGVSRSMREQEDVARAEAQQRDAQAELESVQRELEAEVAALAAAPEPAIEPVEIKAKRGGVEVRLVALAWIPS
jgi:hypothetical protein